MSDRHDDPWEIEMTRTFDQRVRDLHEAPLTLDHVKGKAKRIRRTRRVAATAAGLAVAAVIIPIAVFAGQGLVDEDSGPAPADTPTPNPTATDPGSLGFGYLEGRTLHLPDGATVELPERYDRVTLLGDTVLASRNDDETGFETLDVISDTGALRETVEIVSGPVTDAGHTTAAYVETNGDLVTRSEDGSEVIATGLTQDAYPVAVGRPGVYVSYGDGATPPEVYDAQSNHEVAVPDAIKVNDADGSGLLTVQNKSTLDGSCGGVYDENADEYLWETCDYYLFAFSPDSQYVDATHAYLDGFGNAYAAILDVETQSEVARLAPPEGTITSTAWQDGEHLLATVYDPEGWSIYRLDIDGTVEQVVGPSSKGDDVTPAYTLLGGD